MTINSFLRASLCLLLFFAFYGCRSIYRLSNLRTSEIQFSTTEVTNPNIDISPDGETILFDVLGDLYTVPIAGGKATAITNGLAWNTRGKYSPDGEYIAFLSDRSGTIKLNVRNKKGDDLKEFMVSGYPTWSTPTIWNTPEDIITLNHDTLTAVNIFNGKKNNLFQGKHIPNIYNFGSILFNKNLGFSSKFNFEGIYERNLRTGDEKKLKGVVGKNILSLKVSRDTSRIVYLAEDDREGMKSYSVLRYFNRKENKDIHLTDSISGNNHASFSLTPDNNYVVIGKLGKIVKINLDTGAINEIPVTIPVKRGIVVQKSPKQRSLTKKQIRSNVIRWPIHIQERSIVIYGAFGKLYISNLKTGETKRLTSLQDNIFEYAPDLSFDKQWVVFTTLSDGAQGHLMAVPLDGGHPIRLTDKIGRYVNPTWSKDGKWIAFISDTTEARLGIKSLHKGPSYSGWQLLVNRIPFQPHNISPPIKSIENLAIVTPISTTPTRFYPVPRFSPDGEQLLIASHISSDGSVLGSPTIISINIEGKSQQNLIQFPKSDEVVISPDARSLAFIYNGRLWVSQIPKQANNDSITGIILDQQHARLISEDYPVHVSWEDNHTLIWTKGNVIYRQQIDDKEASILFEVNVENPVSQPEGKYALKGARIITMDGNLVIEDGVILVKNDRILAVGKKEDIPISYQTKVIDLQGKTIIPGLIDVHAHFNWVNKELWMDSDPYYLGNLAFGVTTIYDPSAINTDVFGKAEMIEVGKITGPRIYSSGTPLLQHVNGELTLEDYERIVKGFLPYKSYLGPLKEYAYSERSKRQQLLKAVSKEGFSLTSHPGIELEERLNRVVDGFKGIEHNLSDDTLFEDVLKFVAISDVFYTPTLIVSPRYGGIYKERVNITDKKFNYFFPEEMIEHDTSGLRMGLYATNLNTAVTNLYGLSKYNANICLGAHGNGLPGFGTHLEMWTYAMGGMSNFDILKAATLTGAKKLNLDSQLGSIEVGKKADMVILNSNILENIEDSLDIEYIIKNGFVYQGDTLKQVYP